MPQPLSWDLFCRVIDNFGDLGVCWRLAADLGARGERVRLWVDDPSALAWMAPAGASGVQLLHWSADIAVPEPGDVVVEAFGCDPPQYFVACMAQRKAPPIWINLEYLSAEAYVQRCHGLPSPQLTGPGMGLVKWFYYPGFDASTGGLIRENGLVAARDAFDARAWLCANGLEPRPGERVLSLFCYDGAPLPQLIEALANRPTLLLLAHGAAQHSRPLLGTAGSLLRGLELPWLCQRDYDRLLWACELNFVRGEDSFVRAMWAGAPFVWQIYAQKDAAHAAKLEAFLDQFLAGADAPVAAALRALWRAWNGLGHWPRQLPDSTSWHAQSLRWRQQLLAQPDLATQLLGFVHERR
jgi:uncharacterized repeat protein (TIGR03837 family)